MSAPDREAYAARQAQLLDALLHGDEPPAGFDAAQAGAAGSALRRKRGRAVARAWPALALALGDRYGERFDAFARAVDAPPSRDPLADGLAFAQCLERDELTDDARVELLLARAALCPGGVFAGAARLRRPRRRLLVVARLPWLMSVPCAIALAPPNLRRRGMRRVAAVAARGRKGTAGRRAARDGPRRHGPSRCSTCGG